MIVQLLWMGRGPLCFFSHILVVVSLFLLNSCRLLTLPHTSSQHLHLSMTACHEKFNSRRSLLCTSNKACSMARLFSLHLQFRLLRESISLIPHTLISFRLINYFVPGSLLPYLKKPCVRFAISCMLYPPGNILHLALILLPCVMGRIFGEF